MSLSRSLLFLLFILLINSQTIAESQIVAGYYEQPQHSICIPEETRQIVKANIKPMMRMQGQGITPGSSSPTALPKQYPFYPQGGTLYRDLTTGNFVDLDPSPGVVANYLCESYGNDGHQGTDTGSLTWEEMAIGQPIYAALDGKVIDARDGDPDMNTSCQPGGNWVIIDHGGRHHTWYFHLKQGSVAVSIGEQVRAGQQIGLVGSSGCSFGPHLHFQSMQDGKVFEPFSGPCQTGVSNWTLQQDPPVTGAYVKDMGVTIQDIGVAPPFPQRAPVDREVPLSAGGNIFYWIQFGNLPVNSSWMERYVRPDGSTEFELGPFNFNNPTTFQFSQYWFSRFIGGMATTTGTWRIQFEVNGQLLVDAPVEVVSSPCPTCNNPPLPITATLDPAVPQANDTIFARVDAPTVGTGYRDTDWDIVRYRYRWRVNGVVVRNVISVGMADALPSNLATPGSRISVTIIAGDGVGGGLGATASPVTLTTQIPSPPQGRF